jgi:glucans biosynthesis protein
VANLDKFVIEFSGGEVDKLDQDAEIDAVIDASRGEISNIVVEPVADTGRWRIQFDLDAGGAQPVELRAYLRAGDRALTETWLYQHRWRAQS